MLRSVVTIAAVALASTPAAAATYSARPAASPDQQRIAVRDMLWTCGSGECVGSTQNSRPVVLCQRLAKEAGRIDSFRVDGRDLSSSDLQRCNAMANDRGETAVANAR
jgi:hypothetical protein